MGWKWKYRLQNFYIKSDLFLVTYICLFPFIFFSESLKVGKGNKYQSIPRTHCEIAKGRKGPWIADAQRVFAASNGNFL